MIITDLDSLSLYIKTLIPKINHRIILLDGDLGAGKTAFAKLFFKQLGCHDEISSPSYSIINEYALSNGDPCYHMDLYRLNDISEALQIGIEDYLYTNYWCCIEWSSLIQEIIPQEHHRIDIKVLENNTRTITFN